MKVTVRIAEERLAALEEAVRDALDGDLGGSWYIKLSVPEVAVLVETYRARAKEAAQ